MDKERQKQAPIYTALERFRRQRVVPFDVPGHKRGRGNPELVQLLGEKCVSIDVNSMKPLDNLCHPVSVIRKAEELAADAFDAAHAFLMVGGTTSSVQGMVLAACKPGDKIILPRNVHKAPLMHWCCVGQPLCILIPKSTNGWASLWAWKSRTCAQQWRQIPMRWPFLSTIPLITASAPT